MPKTKQAHRTLKLSVALDELRKWRVVQKRERLKAGKLWQDYGFVFTTEIGTPIDGSNLAGRGFAHVMEAAGLGEYVGPFPAKPKKPKHGPTAKVRRRFVPSHRLYDLRHTFATLSLEAGVPLEVVSRHLGHTNLAFTARTYAMVTRKLLDQGTDLLARVLAG